MRHSQDFQAPQGGVSWSTQSANFVRDAIGPALLLFVCPLAVNLFSYVLLNENFDYGNFYKFMSHFAELLFVQQDYGQAFDFLVLGVFQKPTYHSVKFLLVFTAVQLLLYKYVPGARFDGPQTENGHVPKYCDNGMVCFIMTNAIFYFLVVQVEMFQVTFIYDELIPLLTLLNFSSLFFCAFCT